MNEEHIGIEIKRLREEMLMKKGELAKLCGVSLTYISMVENRVHNPTKNMRSIIFNNLNCVL